MKTVIHKSHTRGHAQHGWLESFHSFSFAGYYNPERVHFGKLRVLNDDSVAPGRGFGTHPHDNMEIISIPLEGDLEHQDSMGNTTVIREGDIQVMSAGTGIQHSEYNKNADKQVKFLQIWVFPKENDVTPRYDQVSISELSKPNEWYQILSPNPDDAGVWVNQDAWFSMADFDAGKSDTYKIQRPGNGVYAFILEGSATVNGETLGRRDAIGVWDTEEVEFLAESDAKILLMDIPMN